MSVPYYFDSAGVLLPAVAGEVPGTDPVQDVDGGSYGGSEGYSAWFDRAGQELDSSALGHLVGANPSFQGQPVFGSRGLAFPGALSQRGYQVFSGWAPSSRAPLERWAGIDRVNPRSVTYDPEFGYLAPSINQVDLGYGDSSGSGFGGFVSGLISNPAFRLLTTAITMAPSIESFLGGLGGEFAPGWDLSDPLIGGSLDASWSLGNFGGAPLRFGSDFLPGEGIFAPGNFADPVVAGLAQPTGEGMGGLDEILRRMGVGKKGPWSKAMDVGSGIFGLLRGLQGDRQARQFMDIANAASNRAIYDPFASSRAGYARMLQDVQRDPAALERFPGYQAGLQAVRRNSAARGQLGSGNEMVDLLNYGGNQYAQLAQLAGAGIGPMGSNAGNILMSGASGRLSGSQRADDMYSRALASLAYGVRGLEGQPRRQERLPGEF